MSEEVKPCPDCGSTAHIENWRGEVYIVKCDKCKKTSFPTGSEEEAIQRWNMEAKWNRRASDGRRESDGH